MRLRSASQRALYLCIVFSLLCSPVSLVNAKAQTGEDSLTPTVEPALSAADLSPLPPSPTDTGTPPPVAGTLEAAQPVTASLTALPATTQPFTPELTIPPVDTPAPAATVVPTVTVMSTVTVAPTATLVPSVTVVPTATLAPTATPMPSVTVVPTATLTPADGPGLALSLAVAPAWAEPEGMVTYTLVITNLSAGPLSPLVLSATLPDGLRYQPRSARGLFDIAAGSHLTGTLANLAPGQVVSETFQAQVTAEAGQVLTSTLSAGGVSAQARLPVVPPAGDEAWAGPDAAARLQSARRAGEPADPGRRRAPARTSTLPAVGSVPQPGSQYTVRLQPERRRCAGAGGDAFRPAPAAYLSARARAPAYPAAVLHFGRKHPAVDAAAHAGGCRRLFAGQPGALLDLCRRRHGGSRGGARHRGRAIAALHRLGQRGLCHGSPTRPRRADPAGGGALHQRARRRPSVGAGLGLEPAGGQLHPAQPGRLGPVTARTIRTICWS